MSKQTELEIQRDPKVGTDTVHTVTRTAESALLDEENVVCDKDLAKQSIKRKELDNRIIIPATKDRFTNNLPDLSQLLCVPINTDELDTITSNMVTIFSNTLETVAPIKLKKVREKSAAPWYRSYTHSLKK